MARSPHSWGSHSRSRRRRVRAVVGSMTPSNTCRGTIRGVIILLVAVVVLLVGLAVAAALGRLPVEGVLPPVTTESFRGLPRGGVDPDDLEDLRFDQVLR